MCVGNGLIERWIIGNDLHSVLWQTINDGEGYVRAAVVSALASLHSSDTLWRDFTLRHVLQACQIIALTSHSYSGCTLMGRGQLNPLLNF